MRSTTKLGPRTRAVQRMHAERKRQASLKRAKSLQEALWQASDRFVEILNRKAPVARPSMDRDGN